MLNDKKESKSTAHPIAAGRHMPGSQSTLVLTPVRVLVCTCVHVVEGIHTCSTVKFFKFSANH